MSEETWRATESVGDTAVTRSVDVGPPASISGVPDAPIPSSFEMIARCARHQGNGGITVRWEGDDPGVLVEPHGDFLPLWWVVDWVGRTKLVLMGLKEDWAPDSLWRLSSSSWSRYRRQCFPIPFDNGDTPPEPPRIPPFVR